MAASATTTIQKPAAPAQSAAPTLMQFLSLRRKHLEDVLPRSSALTVDKLIKLTILAANKTPGLHACTMESVFQCLLTCAELGLDPSGVTGQAYLIPYKDKKRNVTICTLILGYKGLIDLARRGGTLKQIETHIVHERDVFRLRFGLDPLLEHEPCLDGDPGKPRLVYCVAQLDDGAKHVEVMTVSEIDRIKTRKHNWADGPWATDWGEMARKTVARRACKWLPMSTEAARAIERDEDFIDSTAVETSQTAVLGAAPAAPALPAQTQTANVKAQLKARSKVKVVDVAEGETEAQAEQRAAAEPERDPNTGEIIPDSIGQEIPPPTDADFVPVGA